MSDAERVAPGATEDEVVQTEVAETTASEETESTEGQDDSQPAEDDGKPEAKEESSETKNRRERRKAQKERLQREADEAKAERDKANAALAKIKKAAEASRPPKEDDFDDHDQYLLAVGAYQARVALQESNENEITEQASEADKRLERIEKEREIESAQVWEDQRTEAKTRYTDFDEVVSKIPVSQATADLIIMSDIGADVAYHLGSNPELAIAFARMNPLEMAREFGRIESQIQPLKPRTQSNAPEPINTVRPKAGATTDPAKMTVDEYRKWRASGGTF